MPLPVKESPSVSPGNGGFTQQRFTPTDFSGLGQGISQLARGVDSLARIREEEEDVAEIAGRGLRALQQVQTDFHAKKGSFKSEADFEDWLNSRLVGTRDQFVAMPKTQGGARKVFSILDHLVTQAHGRMYADFLDAKDKQFAANQQAQLNNMANVVSSTTSADELSTVFSLADDLASSVALHDGLDREQANVVRREMHSGLWKKAIDARVAANDYQGALEIQKLIQDEDSSGDVVEPSGVPDGKTQTPIGSYAAAAVEKLRVRKSAQEHIFNFMASNKNMGPHRAFFLLNSTKLDKDDAALVNDLLSAAKKDGLNREQLLSAVRERRDLFREEQDRLAEERTAPAFSLFRSGLQWDERDSSGLSPHDYWGALQKKGRKGDFSASKAAEVWWKLWHDSSDEGKEVATPEQTTNYSDMLHKINTDPDAVYKTYGLKGIQKLFVEGRITRPQFEHLSKELAVRAGAAANSKIYLDHSQFKELVGARFGLALNTQGYDNPKVKAIADNLLKRLSSEFSSYYPSGNAPQSFADGLIDKALDEISKAAEKEAVGFFWDSPVGKFQKAGNALSSSERLGLFFKLDDNGKPIGRNTRAEMLTLCQNNPKCQNLANEVDFFSIFHSLPAEMIEAFWPGTIPPKDNQKESKIQASPAAISAAANSLFPGKKVSELSGVEKGRVELEAIDLERNGRIFDLKAKIIQIKKEGAVATDVLNNHKSGDDAWNEAVSKILKLNATLKKYEEELNALTPRPKASPSGDYFNAGRTYSSIW